MNQAQVIVLTAYSDSEPRGKDGKWGSGQSSDIKDVNDSGNGEKPNMLQEGDRVHIHPAYGGGSGKVTDVSPSGLFYTVKHGKASTIHHGSDLKKSPWPKGM